MSPEVISIVSAMLTTLIVILLLALPISVLYIVCQWHLFVKAGEPGWKCLVPIFNSYTAYGLFWNTGWFIASLVIAAISIVISNGISSSDAVTTVMSAVTSIFSLILNIIYYVKLARSFGRSGKFAAGLIFLPIVFMPMLAFGPDKYIGPGGVAPEIPELPENTEDSQ